MCDLHDDAATRDGLMRHNNGSFGLSLHCIFLRELARHVNLVVRM